MLKERLSPLPTCTAQEKRGFMRVFSH